MRNKKELKSPYTDKAFPCSRISVIGTEAKEEVVDQYEQVLDRIAGWKRPNEINKKAKLFVDGTEEGDVIQGNLASKALRRNSFLVCFLSFVKSA